METASLVAAPQKKEPLHRLKAYYHIARKRAWDIRELSWQKLPPVPSADRERWRLVWASVIQQQLQADRFAVKAATDLLLQVPEREATLYYSTMVSDEARHIEGWTGLSHMLEPVDSVDPYLAEMGQMLLDGETLEEKVVCFQVLFEGTAIFAFRDIASATEQTILGEMAQRLIRDDSIHHNSGVAYAEHLLQTASPALKKHIHEVMLRYVPLYSEHVRWRPPERQWLARRMEGRDASVLQRNQYFVNKAVCGLDLRPPYDL